MDGLGISLSPVRHAFQPALEPISTTIPSNEPSYRHRSHRNKGVSTPHTQLLVSVEHRSLQAASDRDHKVLGINGRSADAELVVHELTVMTPWWSRQLGCYFKKNGNTYFYTCMKRKAAISTTQTPPHSRYPPWRTYPRTVASCSKASRDPFSISTGYI